MSPMVSGEPSSGAASDVAALAVSLLACGRRGGRRAEACRLVAATRRGSISTGAAAARNRARQHGGSQRRLGTQATRSRAQNCGRQHGAPQQPALTNRAAAREELPHKYRSCAADATEVKPECTLSRPPPLVAFPSFSRCVVHKFCMQRPPRYKHTNRCYIPGQHSHGISALRSARLTHTSLSGSPSSGTILSAPEKSSSPV